jgi:hypothetical protein
MPKSTRRASERDLNILHRLTVRGLITEFRRVKRSKEPLSAALLPSRILSALCRRTSMQCARQHARLRYSRSAEPGG